jgi:hypothetical protein
MIGEETTRPRARRRRFTIREIVLRAVEEAGGQASLARQLNLKTGNSILNYLRGHAVPQLDRLPALAALAGIRLSDVQAAWWREKEAQGRRAEMIDLALLYVLGLFTLVVVVVGFVVMAAMLRELQKMTRAVAGLIVQETRKLGGR